MIAGMNAQLPRFALVALLVLGLRTLADEVPWDTVAREPIAILQRTWADSPVTEVVAEGDVRASLLDVESVLLDCANGPQFMPYEKECRFLGPPEKDGTQLVYTRLAPPLVAHRDYVLRLSVERAPPDGTAGFRQSWTAVPGAVPEVEGVVRLNINQGSWSGTSRKDGTHLVYRLAVEPGAGVPSFLVRWTNGKAVTDLFQAIEKEAARRGQVRKAQRPSGRPQCAPRASRLRSRRAARR